MAIEAPYSKYRKSNFKIAIFVCIVLASWCAYDGYFNQKWIEDHIDSDGNPEPYLVFNRRAPIFLFGAAALCGAYLFVIKNKKLVAEENELVISCCEKISYDAIQSVDKTNFESKGCFVITYHDETGKEVNRKLSDRAYDNLAAVLEHLVAKIS